LIDLQRLSGLLGHRIGTALVGFGLQVLRF